MLWSSIKSRMGRRIGAVLALCTLIPLIIFAALVLATWMGDGASTDAPRLRLASASYAAQLSARLGAAEALASGLTAEPLAADGSDLRRRIFGSAVFDSVTFVDSDGLLMSAGRRLKPSSQQLLQVSDGGTALITVARPKQLAAAYLGRQVIMGDQLRFAYFELDPAWLWGSPLRSGIPSVTSVVDADGQVLLGELPRTADTAGMLASDLRAAGDGDGRPRPLSWYSGGQEWRGSLVVPLHGSARITSTPLGVVAFEPRPPWYAALEPMGVALPVAMGLAFLCAVLGTAYLAARYVPALAELRRGLMALRQRGFHPLTRVGSDEPRSLVDSLNRAASSIEEQFRALQALGEIDHLLLGSPELEQVLEAMLSRVQAVTRCQSVGIALRDADAPGCGRVYVRCMGKPEQPVGRVALDEDMMSTLAMATAGITVTRCEEARHSFLRPQSELGSEYFWIWPVMVAERLEAILSVGYWEAPAADPHMASSGAQFAARLAIALSKNARDERLYRQAHFDPLTSLPNRLLFRDRLAQEIATTQAGMSRGALLYIDLDHFKRVNDTVGHVAGDQLLTIVAQRLRSCVKEGDTVARLGGDEFTVILRQVVDGDAARAIAERIIESLQLPVSISGRDHFVCASIGITLFPDDSASIEELMRNADTAMYRAKDLGRGRTMFFDRSMTAEPVPATETGLHRALRRREFSLFYQPQFAVSDGSLVGLEALLRWQTAREGVRQPDEFVPAAEESGLIVDIGGWVLESACAQMAAWRDREIAPLRVALNVSLQQLRHSELARNVRRVLDKYGLPASALELEIQPGALEDESAAQSIARLAQIGVTLSLEDFNSGTNTLSAFRTYPFGAVKLDRTLLDALPVDPVAAATVERIIVMAHTSGRRVVAEGVENVEQLNFLREHRCDVAQGFYLARPLAAAAVTELLEAGSSPSQGTLATRAAS